MCRRRVIRRCWRGRPRSLCRQGRRAVETAPQGYTTKPACADYHHIQNQRSLRFADMHGDNTAQQIEVAHIMQARLFHQTFERGRIGVRAD